MNLKRILIGAAIASLAFVGGVLSQTISIPQVSIVNSNDLIPIVPRGVPSAGSQFVSPSQITSQSGYYKSAPAAANSFTFTNNVTYAAFNPAGTIASLYVTFAPAPSDGARNCVFTTQTITAFYVAANTGQSINNAISGTSLSANTGTCYLFSLSNLTWDRD